MEKSSIKYGEHSIDFMINEKETIEGKLLIHVLENGDVLVDTPPGTPASHVRESVVKRARWIEKHQADRHKNETCSSPRQYVSGESHFYLGRRYQLKVDLQQELTQGSVKLKNGYFYVGINLDNRNEVKRLLTEWYRSHATQYFENRLNALKKDLPWARNNETKLQLRTMKKHWGNCSKAGLVTLNPNLVKAPRHCIDYVILHELCHLKEHNHSKAFWKLLDRFSTDWRLRKSELDRLSNLILAS